MNHGGPQANTENKERELAFIGKRGIGRGFDRVHWRSWGSKVRRLPIGWATAVSDWLQSE